LSPLRLEAGQPSTALNIPDERSAASQKSNSTPQCRNLVDATRLSQRATEITRFGRKAQNKSLLIFSGEAYNVEMGVSNEAFPNERNTTPGCATNPTPEDTTNFYRPDAQQQPGIGFLFRHHQLRNVHALAGRTNTGERHDGGGDRDSGCVERPHRDIGGVNLDPYQHRHDVDHGSEPGATGLLEHRMFGLSYSQSDDELRGIFP
jgi:hypothetical protein